MADPREFQRLLEDLDKALDTANAPPRELVLINTDYGTLELRAVMPESRDIVLPKLRELGVEGDRVFLDRPIFIIKRELINDTVEAYTGPDTRPMRFEGTGRKPKRMHKRNRRRGRK